MNDPSFAMNSESRSIPALPAIPVFRSIEEIPADFGPSVAAIGNFDGVHLGHLEILNSVVAEARALGVRSVAVTFDPHPRQFLRPAKAPKLLTLLDERIRLMAATGLDAVLVLRFDRALANLTAKEFVDRVLVGVLGIRALHEGGNFHFGHGARAGIAALERFGAGLGFSIHVHSPVSVRGLEVSSSAIRQRLVEGDLTRVRWMLGRPFAMLSTQVRGRGIGTQVLVPTVNMAPYDGLLPPFGVYVTRLKVPGRAFQAVTNVGNRPTFGEASFAVESHILNFEPMEMDAQTPIELEFLLRLRGEIEWPSPEALKAQIFRDVARAKRYFRLANLIDDSRTNFTTAPDSSE
jgi:riboflavin kinase/FMN adenylyltransferase